MNQHEASGFGLTSLHGDASPVLRGVHAEGRIDGLLFDLTLRQTFRNETSHTLEVVYTFPLAAQAVLLGFAAEFGDRRLEGVVTEKHQAAASYEAALAAGDAPVLLEHVAGSLLTASIGNLGPGEQVVLEVRQAQRLALEQGRLRIALPTTIAPRYGSARRAGLAPEQVPDASATVQHPLQVTVLVAGDLAGAAVECPTHRFERRRTPAGLTLELAEAAWLDRDVVVILTPREPQPSFVVLGRDARSDTAPRVAMAALQMPPAADRGRIALKLLVDCSGSMAGDSIASARRALRALVDGLHEGEWVSYSRFGSRTALDLAPSALDDPTAAALRAAVDRTDAVLGGTELGYALMLTIALPMQRPIDGLTDVLIITDAETWQANDVAAQARSGGHRVFVLVVGSAPAHGAGEAIAAATGGACAYATPGESLEQAALAMLRRIRQRPWTDARLDWGVPVQWQTPLPRSLSAGDTLIAFAGLPPGSAPVVPRLVDGAPGGAPLDTPGGARVLALAEARATMPGDTLARVAAAARLAAAEPAQALQLALAYGLMSPQTSFVLVHARAGDDRTTGVPLVHRVQPMLAAGWGGTGSVGARAGGAREDVVAYDAPLVRAAVGRRPFDDDIVLMRQGLFDEPCNGSWEPDAQSPSRPEALAAQQHAPAARRDEDAALRRFATLREIANAVVLHLMAHGDPAALPRVCRTLALHPAAEEALQWLREHRWSDAEAWMLLARWVVGWCPAWQRCPAEEALRRATDALDARGLLRSGEELTRRLGRYGIDGWRDPHG